MKSDELYLRLIGCGPLRTNLTELRASLRHRYFLMLCAVMLTPMLVASIYAIPEGLGIFQAGQLVGTFTVVVTFYTLVRLTARRTQHIHVSPIILASVFVAQVVIEAIYRSFGIGQIERPADFIVQVAFAFTLAEIGSTLMMRYLASPILTELRRSETDIQTVSMHDVDATPAETRHRFVVIGGRGIDPDALHYIRAEGNYLDVQLATGRIYVKATLTSVLSQVQSSDGILLSRSCWIAKRGYAGYQRRGREVYIRSRDGQEFKVARPRMDDVLPWIALQETEQPRATYA